jgi:hypothetical protein
MSTSVDEYRPGERYVVQYAGGMERLAEASADSGSGARLEAIGPDAPLPRRIRLLGAWTIARDSRLVRDWRGRYWSVAATRSPAAESRGDGGLPGAWAVEFTRAEPDGGEMRYRVEIARPPHTVSDSELARLLRAAWNSLATDAPERLRRLATASERAEL